LYQKKLDAEKKVFSCAKPMSIVLGQHHALPLSRNWRAVHGWFARSTNLITGLTEPSSFRLRRAVTRLTASARQQGKAIAWSNKQVCQSSSMGQKDGPRSLLAWLDTDFASSWKGRINTSKSKAADKSVRPTRERARSTPRSTSRAADRSVRPTP